MQYLTFLGSKNQEIPTYSNNLRFTRTEYENLIATGNISCTSQKEYQIVKKSPYEISVTMDDTEVSNAYTQIGDIDAIGIHNNGKLEVFLIYQTRQHLGSQVWEFFGKLDFFCYLEDQTAQGTWSVMRSKLIPSDPTDLSCYDVEPPKYTRSVNMFKSQRPYNNQYPCIIVWMDATQYILSATKQNVLNIPNPPYSGVIGVLFPTVAGYTINGKTPTRLETFTSNFASEIVSITVSPFCPVLDSNGDFSQSSQPFNNFTVILLSGMYNTLFTQFNSTLSPNLHPSDNIILNCLNIETIVPYHYCASGGIYGTLICTPVSTICKIMHNTNPNIPPIVQEYRASLLYGVTALQDFYKNNLNAYQTAVSMPNAEIDRQKYWADRQANYNFGVSLINGIGGGAAGLISSNPANGIKTLNNSVAGIGNYIINSKKRADDADTAKAINIKNYELSIQNIQNQNGRQGGTTDGVELLVDNTPCRIYSLSATTPQRARADRYYNIYGYATPQEFQGNLKDLANLEKLQIGGDLYNQQIYGNTLYLYGILEELTRGVRIQNNTPPANTYYFTISQSNIRKVISFLSNNVYNDTTNWIEVYNILVAEGLPTTIQYTYGCSVSIDGNGVLQATFPDFVEIGSSGIGGWTLSISTTPNTSSVIGDYSVSSPIAPDRRVTIPGIPLYNNSPQSQLNSTFSKNLVHTGEFDLSSTIISYDQNNSPVELHLVVDISYQSYFIVDTNGNELLNIKVDWDN